MPAVTLGLLDRRQEPTRTPAAEPRMQIKREERENGDAPAASEQDTFSRFVADMLEAAPSERLTPNDALRAWRSWCATHGRNPESQRWLGLRLGQVFAIDERNKRKVYLGVRLKRHSHLRLISAA